MAELAKALTVSQAVALSITTVVGSGLLVLPGIAYQQVGNSAVYAWLINAFLVLPLLFVYAYLGANFPNAGGVAGFVQAAFSRPIAAATEALLLGTFVMGGSAIALTGGHYFTAAIHGNTTSTIISTFLIVAVAWYVNSQGIKVSGRFQQFLAISLVGMLSISALVALVVGGAKSGEGVAPISEILKATPVLNMIFFAYTGFEMLSFTTEEYRNPKRDFPIAVGISFIVVVLLYIVIALSIQTTLTRDNAELVTAPIAAILKTVLGKTSGQFVALVGVLIILSNLVSGSWAASRLVYASAREGFLPKWISVVEPKSQVPRMAVLITMASFAIACTFNSLGLLPLKSLFGLAGQGFFAVNALSVVAYIKLCEKPWQKVLGYCTFIIVLAVMGTFGYGLIFVLALMSIGFIRNFLLSRASVSRI
jgi:amino acid efflux transporter